MANGQEVRRRRYSEVVKQQVMRECDEPSASVAKVAMTHGINANVVHSWRKRTRQVLEMPDAAAPRQPTFVPMMLPPAAVTATATQLQVQIKRGALVISAEWPLEAAAQLGIWTRELLIRDLNVGQANGLQLGRLHSGRSGCQEPFAACRR